jgi:hypothetical protein
MAPRLLDLEGAALLVGGLALCGAAAFVVAKHRHARATPSTVAALVVPRVEGGIVDDGDPDEGAWPTAAQGGAFVDARGAGARPHGELRFLWDAAGLHVLAYAADGDIEPADAMTVTFARSAGPPLVVVISPSHVTLGGAELAAGHDVDGTVGDPRDDDEEWVTELTVPWSALWLRGQEGERLTVSAARCDDTKDGGRRCGAMRETTLVLASNPGEPR